ncbi:hypothetical protein V5799_031998 [Amblyomma americanum]|uniref:Uncharacterized protein n=1 Tax=Amblyomma americanum TaxID=6943 RepID=A0AAQ4DSF0_AMBAM
MSFDLGLALRSMNDSRKVVDFIRRLDSEIDLMLVADLMDESLVLLKHALCWTTKDVVFALRKARMAMYGDCVDSEETADKVFPPQFVFRGDVVGYRLKNVTRVVPASTCRLLAANELLFTNMVRRRQLMDISAFYFARWAAGAAPGRTSAPLAVVMLLALFSTVVSGTLSG